MVAVQDGTPGTVMVQEAGGRDVNTIGGTETLGGRICRPKTVAEKSKKEWVKEDEGKLNGINIQLEVKTL